MTEPEGTALASHCPGWKSSGPQCEEGILAGHQAPASLPEPRSPSPSSCPQAQATLSPFFQGVDRNISLRRAFPGFGNRSLPGAYTGAVKTTGRSILEGAVSPACTLAACTLQGSSLGRDPASCITQGEQGRIDRTSPAGETGRQALGPLTEVTRFSG